MSLLDLSVRELLAELAAGRVTAVEVTEAYLGQIEKHDAQRRGLLARRP